MIPVNVAYIVPSTRFTSQRTQHLQTYLFYDIETTGLSKSFDQVLHFAAIRTDLNFNELERYEIKVKLSPDVIPSPYAMLTHHMRLDEIAMGTCEYDAMQQIHKWMNTPGTISLGYNTLSFDDEFLRFSFYRNLLTPYTHQFANQCSRMDIYPMTVMYYLFKKSILKWPMIDGKVSLKLENLNNENGFISGRAHHAMVDVEVTLALAKVLAKERDMWEYVTGYFNKKTDQERLTKLESDEGLLVQGKLGAKNDFQSVVLSLGNHYHYNNQYLWLRLDDKDFTGLTKETFLESIYTVQKKLGEPGFLLPLKERFTQYITPERQALIQSNKQWLRDNPDIFNFVSEHYRAFKYPVMSKTDIDASLYLNGFWSSQEESFCRSFTNAKPNEKSQLLGIINNPRLYTLALRILGRNFPDALNAKQKEEFDTHLASINPDNDENALIDFKGQKRLTPQLALEQIKELREQNQHDSEKMELLNELEHDILHKHTKKTIETSER